ncbi:MAG: hypothetical protein R3F20_05495 [Planctomycetota bacterium]
MSTKSESNLSIRFRGTIGGADLSPENMDGRDLVDVLRELIGALDAENDGPALDFHIVAIEHSCVHARGRVGSAVEVSRFGREVQAVVSDAPEGKTGRALQFSRRVKTAVEKIEGGSAELSFGDEHPIVVHLERATEIKDPDHEVPRRAYGSTLGVVESMNAKRCRMSVRQHDGTRVEVHLTHHQVREYRVLIAESVHIRGWMNVGKGGRVLSVKDVDDVRRFDSSRALQVLTKASSLLGKPDPVGDDWE